MQSLHHLLGHPVPLELATDLREPAHTECPLQSRLRMAANPPVVSRSGMASPEFCRHSRAIAGTMSGGRGQPSSGSGFTGVEGASAMLGTRADGVPEPGKIGLNS